MNEQTDNTPNTTNFIDENIDSWTDEECLQNFTKFLHRVKMSVELTHNEEGAFVGKQIYLICGELFIESDVVPLDWPLMMAPPPEGYSVQ